MCLTLCHIHILSPLLILFKVVLLFLDTDLSLSLLILKKKKLQGIPGVKGLKKRDKTYRCVCLIIPCISKSKSV